LTPRTTKSTSPAIRERFDEIGRRLASDGPTLQELIVFEDGERKQPSPFAVKMPPAFCESAISLCLLQSSSYFNEEDHETVGIVLADSGGTAGEIWMAALLAEIYCSLRYVFRYILVYYQ
jgi:hypothetical protein